MFLRHSYLGIFIFDILKRFGLRMHFLCETNILGETLARTLIYQNLCIVYVDHCFNVFIQDSSVNSKKCKSDLKHIVFFENQYRLHSKYPIPITVIIIKKSIIKVENKTSMASSNGFAVSLKNSCHVILYLYNGIDILNP